MNFADVPNSFASYKNAEIVILPVPYDETSTWIKGANKGPEAIIQASAHMELYDIETGTEPYQKGIYTAEPITVSSGPKKMVHAVYQRVNEYLTDHKFVVSLGGEHSVSIGPIIAFAEHYPDLTVLQLDAHADLRNEYLGSIYNHACVMSRVSELCPFVQVGVRSIDVEEKNAIHPDRIFWAHELNHSSGWIDNVIDLLTPNVYITIDLDVFDPSVMPSTGTPEPGGLDWYTVLDLLKKISEKVNIVGFDVVELCPNEFNKAPDFLAAKLIYKLLSYKYSQK